MEAESAHNLQTAVWTETTDGTFFRIVAGLFSPEFLYGAGVLLGQNDDSESAN